jgi:hypothetical protein
VQRGGCGLSRSAGVLITSFLLVRESRLSWQGAALVGDGPWAGTLPIEKTITRTMIATRLVGDRASARPVGPGDEGCMSSSPEENDTEGARWMPRRLRPMKDVATRRNASGSGGHATIRGSPNGATRRG